MERCLFRRLGTDTKDPELTMLLSRLVSGKFNRYQRRALCILRTHEALTKNLIQDPLLKVEELAATIKSREV